jgi:hypothetical protein
MHFLLHWGSSLNLTPVVYLVVATFLVFFTRTLTVWFYLRTLRLINKGTDNEEDSIDRLREFLSSKKTAVPVIVSSLYFLTGILLIGSTLWGMFSTAWWMLPLGVIFWWLVHHPFKKEMESWASFQTATEKAHDSDTLLKGELTPDQEASLKKRLGLK